MEAAALAGVLVALAALPSASVALVVARAASGGVASGVAVAAGVVLGDLVFVALAILGLAAAAEALGGLFVLVRIAAGGYLVWLGVGLLRSRASGAPVARAAAGSRDLAASLLAGFALTLGDLKAILFYASLFPLFVDPAAVGATDIALIAAITVLSVGSVKVVYAFCAARLAARAGPGRFGQAPRRAAGALLVGAGGWIVLRA